jgi:hypothetical protein
MTGKSMLGIMMVVVIMIAFIIEIASLVVPLSMRGSMPYLREGTAWYLVDTGASISIIKGEPLGVNSMMAVKKLRAGENSAMLPPGVDGILGWNWLSQYERVAFHLSSSEPKLYIDENAPFCSDDPKYSAKFTVTNIGAGELPCVSFTAYGVASTDSPLGILDTASPVTIVSPTLCDSAALFDPETDVEPLLTYGADGTTTKLIPKLAHGIFLGGTIQRTRCTVYRGDLPMLRAVGLGDRAAALVGLDLLGDRFCFDNKDRTLHVW